MSDTDFSNGRQGNTPTQKSPEKATSIQQIVIGTDSSVGYTHESDKRASLFQAFQILWRQPPPPKATSPKARYLPPSATDQLTSSAKRQASVLAGGGPNRNQAASLPILECLNVLG